MIDADERALMQETVRGAIADALASSDAGADIDAVLAGLGWLDLLRDEPGDAIDIVFTAIGATNATATALDDVVASALGREPRADVAVLLPRFGGWEPPGRVEGGRLHVQGLATGRATSARDLLVACGGAAGPSCVTIPLAVVEPSAVRGVDPASAFHSVDARVETTASTAVAAREGAAAWESAVALARRALSHEIAGASRTMLDLARSHALEREQFGRPIARFQAVRHRLAETLVAIEGLEASLSAARDEPNADTAALAKAVAGRTARTVAAHCQQVLAGVGFTTEHPFHRFLKRTMVLEGLFGTADEIVLALGRQLLATRRVPTLIEL